VKLRFTSFLVLALAVFVLPAMAASVLYTNGPINGNVGAYSFTGAYGWEVADTFTLGSQSTITSFDMGVWVFPGDLPVSADWKIMLGGPDWLGGTVLASGTGTFSNVYWGLGFGYYDIYTSSISGLNVSLGAGTYWLELLNGVANVSGDPVYWDENDGASQANQINTGTIGSEAFTIYGTPGGGVPEPSSILMLGSGLLGVAGVIRRKLL
jgi:hypothetical protein